jgi:hypothetical protein
VKTKIIRPEVLNRHLGAAVIMTLKALHNIDKGIRVTQIATEGTDLDPTGVQYTIRIDIQISGDPPELPEEIKNPPS